MSGEHAPRIQSAGGTATMSGEHAPRIQSAGGKTRLGKISKKHRTAAQAANAEYQPKWQAAKRARGAH